MEGPRNQEGQEEINMRLEEAYKSLRESPVAQAYWQVRTLISKNKREDFTYPDQQTLNEILPLLEESTEIKTLKKLGEKLGKGEDFGFPKEK